MLLTLGTSAVLADKGPHPPVDKQFGVGESNVGFLHFYDLLFEDSLYEIIWDGASGELKFNLSGPAFFFVFNAHGLEPNTEYSLMLWDDDWVTNWPKTIIASGASNDGGNIHLASFYDFGEDITDAKFWLVLSNDWPDGYSVEWNGNDYLFGDSRGISYDYIEPAPERPHGKSWNPSFEKREGVGESNVAFSHYYELLYTNFPTEYEVVWDGAWAKMKFNLAGSTFDYVFNGHGLEPNTGYTLVYWTGGWPSIVVSSGTTDDEGNIYLEGSYDFNHDLTDASIWIVLSSDLWVLDGLCWPTVWNPNDYLWPETINYDDTDVP